MLKGGVSFNVRWGDERSYTRIIPDELPFAFLGLEKHGIYSIGTYGCCKTAEYKHHLREGLRSFIEEIEPEINIQKNGLLQVQIKIRRMQ